MAEGLPPPLSFPFPFGVDFQRAVNVKGSSGIFKEYEKVLRDWIQICG